MVIMDSFSRDFHLYCFVAGIRYVHKNAVFLMLKTKRIVLFCLVITLFVPLVIIYRRVNPDYSNLFPRCPFRLLTGYACPGCGSQRAIHYLLNFKIDRAIQANALMVLSVPYVLLLSFSELLKSKSRFFERLYQLLFSAKSIWTTFSIIVLWWFARNI